MALAGSALGNVAFFPPRLGRVIQIGSTADNVRAATTTLIPGDDTTPTSSEGTLAMDLTMAAASTTNRFCILWWMTLGGSATIYKAAPLFTSSSTLAIAVGFNWGSVGLTHQVYACHNITVPVSSAMTFQVRYGGNTGTTVKNRQPSALVYNSLVESGLFVMEYST